VQRLARRRDARERENAAIAFAEWENQRRTISNCRGELPQRSGLSSRNAPHPNMKAEMEPLWSSTVATVGEQ